MTVLDEKPVEQEQILVPKKEIAISELNSANGKETSDSVAKNKELEQTAKKESVSSDSKSLEGTDGEKQEPVQINGKSGNESAILTKRIDKNTPTKISKIFKKPSKSKKKHIQIMEQIIFEEAVKLDEPTIPDMKKADPSKKSLKTKLHRISTNNADNCDEDVDEETKKEVSLDMQDSSDNLETGSKSDKAVNDTIVPKKKDKSNKTEKSNDSDDDVNVSYSARSTLSAKFFKKKQKLKKKTKDEPAVETQEEAIFQELSEVHDDTSPNEAISKAVTFDSRSCWFQYVSFFDFEKMTKLLNSDKSIINEIISSTSKKTALHMAFSDGAPISTTMYTPMNDSTLKAEKDAFVLASFLIKNGANVNAADGHGSTPLHYAVQAMFPKGVKLLLNAGANPNTMNIVGQTPRDLCHHQSINNLLTGCPEKGNKKEAAKQGKDKSNMNFTESQHEDKIIELVKRMKEKQVPKKNMLTLYGTTYLPNVAAENSLYKLMLVLIKEIGFTVNESDGFYNTPLHRATRKFDLPMMKILAEHGANPMLINYSRENVLDLMEPEYFKQLKSYAKKHSKSDLMKVLFKSNKASFIVDNALFLNFVTHLTDANKSESECSK